MPNRALRPCNEHECNNLTKGSSGYCPEHIYLVEQLKKQCFHRQEALRGSARERGYDSRWEKARRIFLMNNPLRVECLKEDRFVPSKVVDHIKLHRGNKKLFWDKNNWQSLCVTHHNKKTASGK